MGYCYDITGVIWDIAMILREWGLCKKKNVFAIAEIIGCYSRLYSRCYESQEFTKLSLTAAAAYMQIVY